MAKTKGKKHDPYSKEVIRRKRTFPTARAIGLAVLLIVQLLIITGALLYTPTPQDRIEHYELIASPREDGTVDLEYRFIWTALDPSEDLTWIEIGMPNEYFSFYKESLSSNIASYETYVDGDYISARLYLDRPYKSGESLTFSFRVRQQELLCRNDTGYHYELIPGWFNATPVESYRFVWKGTPSPLSSNTTNQQNGDLIWEGSMPCGTYVSMQVYYDEAAFAGSDVVEYQPFNDAQVADDLQASKNGLIFLACIACLLMLITQLYMIDGVVSYHRGRGFLTGYGHHVHIYGRTNAVYRRERDKHTSSGSRSGGGGCACACACACAGGGRAGCSQKDTHAFPLKKTSTDE